MGFWGGLGLLQFLLGGLHSRFELAELGLADALDGEAQRRLLARDELVLGVVPVLLPIAGVASLPYGFAACAHAGAGGHGGAVQAQFGLEVDAAGVCAQAPGARMEGQMRGCRIHEQIRL